MLFFLYMADGFLRIFPRVTAGVRGELTMWFSRADNEKMSDLKNIDCVRTCAYEFGAFTYCKLVFQEK